MAKNILLISCDIAETRVALIEGGIIAELHIERGGTQPRGGTVGDICLGKVTRVLPGLQAAFVDVGLERAAFLHVEDLIRPDDFEAYLAGGRKHALGAGEAATEAPAAADVAAAEAAEEEEAIAHEVADAAPSASAIDGANGGPAEAAAEPEGEGPGDESSGASETESPDAGWDDGDGGGAAMRRLDVADIEIVVREYRASYRTDQHCAVLHAQVFERLREEFMSNAVTASRAIVRLVLQLALARELVVKD